MDNIINFDGVSYAIDGKIILNNLNFNIKRGSFVSLIGDMGSGKSTIVNILAGIIPYNGYVAVNGYYLNRDNIFDIRKCSSVILDDVNNLFVNEIVSDELSVGLNNLGVPDITISKRVMDIAKLFGIDDILNSSVFNITNSQRVKVFLASSLVTDPDVLIIDDCLHQLSVSDKKQVFNILKDYNKKKKLTIIMVTHNMEDVLVSDRVLVLNKGKLVLDGTVLNVFKQKDKLYNYGINVPFIIDLSIRLMERKVIDHVYLDMRKLVDDLWK